VNFYCTYVAPGSKQRRQLSVHVRSQSHERSEDNIGLQSAVQRDGRLVDARDIQQTKDALPFAQALPHVKMAAASGLQVTEGPL
jgi:hypothetical protein